MSSDRYLNFYSYHKHPNQIKLKQMSDHVLSISDLKPVRGAGLSMNEKLLAGSLYKKELGAYRAVLIVEFSLRCYVRLREKS